MSEDDELATLTEETNELEDVITYEVREPQMEVDRARRRVARARVNQIEAEKRMKQVSDQYKEATKATNRLEQILNENDRLTRENVMLKNKIEDIEAQIAGMKPSELEKLQRVMKQNVRFDAPPRKRFMVS